MQSYRASEHLIRNLDMGPVGFSLYFHHKRATLLEGDLGPVTQTLYTDKYGLII